MLASSASGFVGTSDPRALTTCLGNCHCETVTGASATVGSVGDMPVGYQSIACGALVGWPLIPSQVKYMLVLHYLLSPGLVLDYVGCVVSDKHCEAYTPVAI